MVTLATLPTATAQEVFDQIAIHLLTQNEKSANDDSQGLSGCFYRKSKDTKVLKCAAGCLISDEEYDPKYDKGRSTDWKSIVTLFNLSRNHLELIENLQQLHDRALVIDWKSALIQIATNYNLQYHHLDLLNN